MHYNSQKKQLKFMKNEEKYLIYEDILDFNNDNIVSENEVEKAKKLFRELDKNNYF